MEEGGGMEVELSGNHSGRRQMFQMSLDVAVTEVETHTQNGQSGPEGVLRIVVFLLLI